METGNLYGATSESQYADEGAFESDKKYTDYFNEVEKEEGA